MKKFFISLITLVSLIACSDTGTSSNDSFDASVVCPAEGTNIYGMPNRGTFTDERDGQVYKYTTIADKVWMAENLNYDAPFSGCYNDDPFNCEIYGKIYNLFREGNRYAGGLLDIKRVTEICPKGFHVPDTTEWFLLFNSMGGYSKDLYKHLVQKDAWTIGDWATKRYTGIKNECDFSILPGSWNMTSNGIFGPEAYFMTSIAADIYSIYTIEIPREDVLYNSKGSNYIRCIMD